jgi:hypothetical protein
MHFGAKNVERFFLHSPIISVKQNIGMGDMQKCQNPEEEAMRKRYRTGAEHARCAKENA